MDYTKILNRFTGINLSVCEISAMHAINELICELQLAASGIPMSELGISERRRSKGVTKISGDQVAHIPIHGYISEQGMLSTPSAYDKAAELRAAYADASINGIVLDMSSFGGESVGGDIILSALKDRNKPVIAHVLQGASAAYHIASGADEIIAQSDRSIFGSLGTIIQIDKAQLQEFKDAIITISSDLAPEKNADYLEAVNGDFTRLKKVVNEATALFHKSLLSNRPIIGATSEDKRKQALSGNTFHTQEAKKLGLVDSVGGLNFAIERIKKLI